MTFLNGWIDIPDEDLEKDIDKVCRYCQTNPNECGEWEQCCYDGVKREIVKMKNIGKDKTESKHTPFRATVFDFMTGKVVDLGGMQ